MKTKILFISLVALIAVFSCKKEECETCPIITTKDIVGKWKLSEISIEGEATVNNIVNNNLNRDSSNINHIDTYSEVLVNNIIITEYVEKYNELYKHMYLNSTTNTFQDTVEITELCTLTKYTKNYTIEIEIKSDNTWEAIYSTSILTKYRKYYKVENNDTVTTSLIDSTYLSNNIETITETGNWYWKDNNNDQNIIYAGPLVGKIKLINNNEIIIEDIFIKTNNEDSEFTQNAYTYEDVNNQHNTDIAIFHQISNSDSTSTLNYKWIKN